MKQKGLPFHKIQGAGNDAIVFFRKDLKRSSRQKPAFLQKMAHRQLGIGTDQFVEVVSLKPLAVQIWNSDGSTAEMCANGTRSFLFLAEQMGWLGKKIPREVPIQVSGKGYRANKIRGGYELCLGRPELGAPEALEVGGFHVPFRPVSTGNPHAVILHGREAGQWQSPSDFSFLRFGPVIETHARFPKRTNVEFVRSWKLEGRKVRARVEAWERGAGATLSCGSGAVAVAAVLRDLTGAEECVVEMNQFELRIRFEGDQAFLSGPCALVAKGEYFSS